MNPRRRKTLVWLLGIATVGVFVVVGVTQRHLLYEQLYLWDLESEDVTRRRHAAERLAEMGSTRCIPCLAEILRDEDEWYLEFRSHAGTSDSKTLPLPVNLPYSAHALAQIGMPAVPALRELLDSSVEPQRAAAYALLAIARHELSRSRTDSGKAAAIPALIHLVRKGVLSATRMKAAEMLARMGPDAAAAVPTLAEVLRKESGGLQRAAARALVRIGPASLPVFFDAISHRSAGARMHAAYALGRILPASPRVRHALVKALSDQNADVRRFAGLSLGRIRSEQVEIRLPAPDRLK